MNDDFKNLVKNIEKSIHANEIDYEFLNNSHLIFKNFLKKIEYRTIFYNNRVRKLLNKFNMLDIYLKKMSGEEQGKYTYLYQRRRNNLIELKRIIEKIEKELREFKKTFCNNGL